MDTNKLHRYLNLPFEVEKPWMYDHIDMESHREYGFMHYPDIVPDQLKDWIESKGLHIGIVEFFYQEPHTEMRSIHIDSPTRIYNDIPIISNHVKINFYFDCPKGSYMCWYEHLDPKNPDKWVIPKAPENTLKRYRSDMDLFKFLQTEEQKQKYYDGLISIAEDHLGNLNQSSGVMVERQNIKKVYEVECTKPSLVNAGQLHNAINPTDNHRWTFCVVPVWGLDHRGEKADNLIHWDDAIHIFKDEII